MLTVERTSRTQGQETHSLDKHVSYLVVLVSTVSPMGFCSVLFSYLFMKTSNGRQLDQERDSNY